MSATHPAFDQIRSALIKESYTSGTCQIDMEQCGLYYQDRTADDASLFYLNLASATDDDLSHLISSCDAAPFGRGTETVMDATYRKAHKLDVSQFGMAFDLASTPILNKISQDLVDMKVSVKRAVRAERYKLNVYDKGGFFKAHQDTPRAENMFGSLVIVFPTPHEGGTLILRDEGVEWSFDAAQLLASVTSETPNVAYVAFYSDLEHEVMPVVSGSRVTLTYNLYFDNMATVVAPVFTSQGKDHAIKDGLQQLLADTTFLPNGGLLGFTLSHSYPLRHDAPVGYTVSELLPYLKGSDALIYSACRELGLEVQLNVHYTADNGGTYLSTTPIDDDDEGEYSDDDVFIECAFGWRDQDDGQPRKVVDAGVLWVADRPTNNGVKSRFMIYGNQHSITFAYGIVCLIINFRRSSIDVGEGGAMETEDEE
ncbi:hypothetical protein BDZ89DRAFT_1074557 [Hymenopellis radicata]|nr:hypothetical protein BDZ89DRAFT_1074557 [Hymenopellis radicata]